LKLLFLSDSKPNPFLPVILKKTNMFGLFKKKDKKAELQKKYESLLKEAFDLSSTDRKASDIKQAEAEEVAKEIEALS
jgi:hypothetical protein